MEATVDPRCRCWMVRPADDLPGPVCAAFVDSLRFLGALDLCGGCDHAGACHGEVTPA
jgi:hypothetical protein